MRVPGGGLAVLFDKNPMETWGYAAALANLTGEEVHLVPLLMDKVTNTRQAGREGGERRGGEGRADDEPCCLLLLVAVVVCVSGGVWRWC